MRIAQIQSYSEVTRMSIRVFFWFFMGSFPFYYCVYHLGFVEYVANPIPIHIKDSLSCVRSYVFECLGIILVGNIAMCGSLFAVYGASSYLISKQVAYLISVFTFPMMLTGVYYLLSGMFSGGGEGSGAIYAAPVIFFGAVVVSLMPPFCRRRAYIIKAQFVTAVKVVKMFIRLVLIQRSVAMLFPAFFGLVYLGFLLIHRSVKKQIETTVLEETLHKFFLLFLDFLERVLTSYFIVKTWFRVQKAPDSSKSAAILGLFLLFFLCLFVVLYSLSCAFKPQRYAMVVAIVYYLVKSVVEWLIPLCVVGYAGGFRYVDVWNRKGWVKKHFIHGMYFSISKFYVAPLIVIPPMAFNYHVFNREHKATPSELSICLSFLRLTSAYIHSFIESGVITIFIGEKLGILLRSRKRVTYTTVAPLYRNICQENRERTGTAYVQPG